MERLKSHWSSTCVAAVFACHLATVAPPIRIFLSPYQNLPGPDKSLVTPFTPLRISTRGILTLHTTHTQPTIPMMLNPALPQSASATAEAQEPYDFRTLPSMLRVLEPSAPNTPELSPLANTVGSGLGVDLPQKMFYFLLSSTHVMVKS